MSPHTATSARGGDFALHGSGKARVGLVSGFAAEAQLVRVREERREIGVELRGRAPAHCVAIVLVQASGGAGAGVQLRGQQRGGLGGRWLAAAHDGCWAVDTQVLREHGAAAAAFVAELSLAGGHGWRDLRQRVFDEDQVAHGAFLYACRMYHELCGRDITSLLLLFCGTLNYMYAYAGVFCAYNG